MFSGRFKFTNDDDDDFFPDAAGPNNLSKLFGTAMGGGGGGTSAEANDNVTLKYKAPKTFSPESVTANNNNNNNNDGENSTASSTETTNDWNLFMAEVVSGFKLQNDTNVSQGKIGLALLKNVTTNNLRIILYRTKTNILSTTNLDKNRRIFMKNDYLQFQDDALNFWSVLFESVDKRELIVQQIRDKCSFEGEDVVAQDVKAEETMMNKSEDVIKEVTTMENGATVGHDNIIIEQTKADIVLRMAKMGQAMPVPKFGNTNTDMSDSSDNETQRAILPSTKPSIPARKNHHYRPLPFQQTPVIADESTPSAIIVPFNPNPTFPQNSSLFVVPSGGHDSTSSMNVLFAENRTQNTEVRMNLMKLDSKLDQVLDRFDHIKLQRGGASDPEEEIINLEEKILQLKKENRLLRLQSKEQMNSQSRDKEFEDIIAELRTNLESEKQSNKLLHDEIQALDGKLNENTNSFAVTESKYRDNLLELQHSKENLLELKSEIEILKKVIEEHEKEKETTNQKVEIKPQISDNAIEDAVKEVFNNIYKSIDQLLVKSEKSDPTVSKVIQLSLRQQKTAACHSVRQLFDV